MDNYVPLSEASKLTGKHLKTIRRYIKAVSEQTDTHGLLVKRVETPQGYSWLIRKDIITSFPGKKTDNKTYNTPIWGGHSSKNVQVDISKNVQVDILTDTKADNKHSNVRGQAKAGVYNTPIWGGHSPKNVQVDNASNVQVDTANIEAKGSKAEKNVQVDITKNVQVDILTGAMADNMKSALKLLEHQLAEKDKQLLEKDKQISSLLERQRESHILINTQMKQIENGFASLAARAESSDASLKQEQGRRESMPKRIYRKHKKHTAKPKKFIQQKQEKRTVSKKTVQGQHPQQKQKGFLSWFLGE